jgi:hypothetical protein
MKVEISEETERRFRQAAMKRFGYRKGALSAAAEEAFRKWVRSVEEVPEFRGDPVEAIEGLVADVDMDSVELQHLIPKLWAEMIEKEGKSVSRRHKRVSRGSVRPVKKR